MVSVPFALLLPWKQARGRGARDFCIAGGIPGQCIGKVLFTGSLVTIAPSCQPAYIPMMLSLHGVKVLFCFCKHGSSKYSGNVSFGVFLSFWVKHIKVFWILFWNKPVHKSQILNYYSSALGLPEENEYSRLSASTTAGSSIQRHRESHTSQVSISLIAC